MVGIVHAGLAPVIEVAEVHPNVALVAVVLVTTTLGLGPGIMWAFTAGLIANLQVSDPLGSIPLTLLLVSVVVAGGDRVFGRLVWIYPIGAAFAASVLADAVNLGLGRVVDPTFNVGVPLELILSAAVLNAAIVGLLLYPVRTLSARLGTEERPAW